MKLPASFKLSKSTKRALAKILDPHLRGVIRRSMAQAEYAASMKTKTSRSKDD